MYRTLFSIMRRCGISEELGVCECVNGVYCQVFVFKYY